LQFGGILTPIPDIASFTLFNFIFDTGEFGIPIGQHAGTEGIEIPFFVENHGLEVDVSPETFDPELRVDDDTLRIKPGEFGRYVVKVRNLGSVAGDFDSFSRDFSNQRGQSAPFTFIINPNTDTDCIDSAGIHFQDDPYDGAPDDCFDSAGMIRADRIELIDEDPIGPAGGSEAQRDEDGDGVADEDPADVWASMPTAAGFGMQVISGVPAYSESTPPPDQSLILELSPFRHPLTAPGRYPFRVVADSSDAARLGLDPVDPSGNFRIGASDVGFIEVNSFFDPEILLLPNQAAGKPGVPIDYTLEGSNGGNDDDSMVLATQFADFNQGGCTLTTLGKLPECLFRAVPTVIPAHPDAPAEEDWTTIRDVPDMFGPLEPLDIQTDAFRVLPPRDWAGMQDTTYQFVTTVVSVRDSETPPATNSAVAQHTVIATKESMTRYIGLEIRELIGEIESANAIGISTGGLLPIAMHPAELLNQRALDSILAGNPSGATRAHEANIHIMREAFLRALSGAESKLPPDLASGWRARGEAIVEDLTTAAVSDVPSAP
jgi:hypothetical protein